MLTWALPALAVTTSAWLDDLDRGLDEALPSVQSCVSYARVTDKETSDMLSFELRWTPSGKVKARRTYQTMMETWIGECLARELSKRSLPRPPGEQSALVAIGIFDLKPYRAARSTALGPSEAPALPRALFRAHLHERHRAIVKSCLQSLVKRGGDDAGAVVRVAVRLQDDGALDPRPWTASQSPELEACVLEHLAWVRLPTGFEHTPPYLLSFRLTGEGGGVRGRLQALGRVVELALAS